MSYQNFYERRIVVGYNISVLECPNCAATDIRPGQSFCHWCRSALIISDFSSIYSMSNDAYSEYADKLTNNKDSYIKNGMQGDYENSLGMAYLRLGNTSLAVSSFKKAAQLGIQNPETYFYMGIAMLNKQRPFLSSKNNVSEVIECIETAINIEKKGIYYFTAAFVEYDFYELKHLRPPEPIDNYLSCAKRFGVTQKDIKMVFDMINYTVPNELLTRMNKI